MKIYDLILKPLMNLFDESFNFARVSYSQDGEDLIMETLLENTSGRIYLDVGAHHPFRFSNTYLFYKKGWRGLNIDATPGSMELFKKYRPLDINLEIAISNSNDKNLQSYYIFNEPALNSFSKKLSRSREKNGVYKIEKVIKLKQSKLSAVLGRYLVKNSMDKIDFMSIDVEGKEYEVLSSNDWKLYRPKFIMVEMMDVEIEDLEENCVYALLTKNKYFLVGKTPRTAFFKSSI